MKPHEAREKAELYQVCLIGYYKNFASFFAMSATSLRHNAPSSWVSFNDNYSTSLFVSDAIASCLLFTDCNKASSERSFLISSSSCSFVICNAVSWAL
jgi:hypothetical protein